MPLDDCVTYVYVQMLEHGWADVVIIVLNLFV